MSDRLISSAQRILKRAGAGQESLESISRGDAVAVNEVFEKARKRSGGVRGRLEIDAAFSDASSREVKDKLDRVVEVAEEHDLLIDVLRACVTEAIVWDTTRPQQLLRALERYTGIEGEKALPVRRRKARRPQRTPGSENETG